MIITGKNAIRRNTVISDLKVTDVAVHVGRRAVSILTTLCLDALSEGLDIF